MFSPTRLIIARKRRRLTSRELAEKAGLSHVTISRIENDKHVPDENSVRAIALVLGFPERFFFGEEVDLLDPDTASFRSQSAMTAREREAALAAGSIAYMLADWVSERFKLPAADLLDLSHERAPESAARALRQHWGLGEQPVSNMIKLLESKGVRVFSLAENTRHVDAFSCWRNDTPYVFLNTMKSTEHSRFDAAHELGHLILHKHAGPSQKSSETEANRFAAAFLMPEADVRSVVPRAIPLEQLVMAKKRWGVSVAALAYRLKTLQIIGDWQHRTFCIQMTNLGFRQKEPDGLPREQSVVWEQVLTQLWKEKTTKAHIAKALLISDEDVEDLVFGLNGKVDEPFDSDTKQKKLRLLKS